jgi:pyruvate/2-oxoglutarate/acetoin dehydrogenase E1 component
MVDGREVIRTYFNALFEREPRVVAIGEDIGMIGDVNQGFAGLQEKYGESGLPIPEYARLRSLARE